MTIQQLAVPPVFSNAFSSWSSLATSADVVAKIRTIAVLEGGKPVVARADSDA